MDVFFERAESGYDFVRWGRDEYCIPGHAPANPVLGPAKFTRSLMSAARPLDQHLVHFANKPQAEGQRLQELDPTIHCADVVRHLLHVIERNARDSPVLVE